MTETDITGKIPDASVLAEALKKHEAFWGRKSTNRPLTRIRRTRRLFENTDVNPGMLDPHLLNPSLSERLLQGDLFRIESPFSKIPWMEAIAGCEIHAGADEAMWAKPVIHDDAVGRHPIAFDSANPWLRKLLELTRSLVHSNDGSYLVSQALQRGPCDILSAFLGDTRMGLWFYDHPDRIHQLLSEAADAFIAVTKAQYDLIPAFHGGWALWNYGLWAPGSVTRLQTDASVQISREMYGEFILPYERRIMESFEYSLMDLHSGGTLIHHELLLQEPDLNAISVTLDPHESSPTIPDLLTVFRRILEAKSLLIFGEATDDEVRMLMEELPPQGLCINVLLAG